MPYVTGARILMHQPGEPSVEEILDSIKKVIARDNRAIGMPRYTDNRAEPADAEEAEEVLELAEDEILSASEAAPVSNEELLIDEGAEPLEYGPWQDDDDISAEDDTADEDEDYADDLEGAPLTSADVRTAMRDNLAALAMLSDPKGSQRNLRAGETSLEELTRELLRPMLAEWLDENLPGMVERLVKAEIARIGKKAR